MKWVDWTLTLFTGATVGILLVCVVAIGLTAVEFVHEWRRKGEQ